MKRLSNNEAALWQRTDHCPSTAPHAPHDSPDGWAWCPGVSNPPPKESDQ